MLTRSEERDQNQNSNLAREIPENDKLENINQQLNTAVNFVQQVQQSDCVYIECNPILDHHSHEQTNFISVHQQHQSLGPVNYNIPHHNQIQIGGYALQNVGQLQVYNGTYTMPLQTMQCNQPQLQVSNCF